MSQDARNEYFDKSIEELKRHADTSNREVGLIQIDMAVVKNDINNIKSDIGAIKPKLDEIHGTIRYWLGGLAVIMFVITIVIKLI